MTDQPIVFETPDLGIISALHCVHAPIVNRYVKEGKVYFVFEGLPEVMQTVDDYQSNQLNVSALSYFDSLREVKRQIYALSKPKWNERE